MNNPNFESFNKIKESLDVMGDDINRMNSSSSDKLKSLTNGVLGQELADNLTICPTVNDERSGVYMQFDNIRDAKYYLLGFESALSAIITNKDFDDYHDRAIYRMNIDFGRLGELSGVFVADRYRMYVATFKQVRVYFGEVLGKHSEIIATLSPDNVKLISAEKEIVDMFEEFGLSSGYNPLEYEGYDLVSSLGERVLDMENKDDILDNVLEEYLLFKD